MLPQITSTSCARMDFAFSRCDNIWELSFGLNNAMDGVCRIDVIYLQSI